MPLFPWSAPCSYHTGIRSYVNLIRLPKARATYSGCLIHMQPNLVAGHTSDDCAPWPKSAAILHSSCTVGKKMRGSSRDESSKSFGIGKNWWTWPGSNRRPPARKARDSTPPTLSITSFAKTLQGPEFCRVTISQVSPHAYHFKRILNFGEGHAWSPPLFNNFQKIGFRCGNTKNTTPRLALPLVG